ncbi:piezo-type mechanosensitive ion channel component 2 isoform X1 [Triplophysa dalaica]|uniref:piezo-type mechanosensitive ion channel component 2 isoform X1 n=1 Tax=Triplophysa dalaica TaxID=1582913 RepID=UPI0024DFEFE7|nr:piezo-type mechanosensitive ion channel component 2 isoform X1 [Triplophysa dalaica]XP_056594419.1 piezo-type mechanosensitive ion channel component 2 isoform X1 [Triplophysa dalaica]
MASEVVCGLMFRLLLPVCLAAACLFRYNWLSFVYLIYLLLIPLFAEPTKTTMRGHTGRLLKSLCFTSMTFLLLHIVYQITINSLLAGDNIEPDFNCSSWERSIRQLGFESVRGADAGNGIRVFIPDIGMFVLGLVTWLLCRNLEKQPVKDVSQHNSEFEVDNQEKEEEEEEKKDEKLELEDELLFEDFELADEDCELPEEEEVDVDDGECEEPDGEESTKIKILRQIADVASKLKEIIGNLITTAGKVVVTILLGLTGIMLPSLTSTVYFFTFLGLCTWWSFCRTFDPLLFSCLCVLMAIFSAGHLIMLYLYQFQFFQGSVPPGDSYASLFGISPVVLTDCSHTWMFKVNPNLEWHHFVNPIMLLVLYYTLATLIRLWLQESEDMVKEKSADPEVREDPESPESNAVVYTAEKKRQLWRMARYHTDERNLFCTQDGYSSPEVLIITSNGASLDFTSVPCENGPKSVELYSTPHYKPGQLESDPQKMDGGVYEIESAYVELSEVPNPFDVVRVNSAVKAFRFIMKQSYICALIAMMAWSITYVSWLTFVFLIWSCTLWMVRDRRKYSMITSPFMVFYGNLLIILQYIWSFESLQPVPGLFLKKDVPFRELGSKILCLLSFWLLLRQSLTERKERQTDDSQLSDIKVEETIHDEPDDGAGCHREMMDVLGSTLMAMLNKYWIYICGGMFFFVSFEGRIVMYKIIYMMMFLFCVALYQLNYERWRWMLKYFWMSVVVYTMLVLILVYTFQFESSIHVWSNMTGMSREKLEDLGLEKFSVPALFTRIFIPTSFLLVCILHLHYFHERFLQLTDIKSVADKQKSTISRLVHLDGSLVDISMVKPSFSSTINEEEVEERVDLEKEAADVKQREEEKISESNLLSEGFTCQVEAGPVPEPESDLKNKWHLVVERLTVLFLKFLDYVQKMQIFIWWLLELHIIKIVSSYIIWVSVKEVSLFNYVFLVSWAFALPFNQFRPLASSVCTVWTCVIIVCKMLYQLTSININTYSKNCTMPDNYTDAQKLDMAKSLLYSGSVDPANWVGLRKFSPLLENLRINLLMLALLAFEVTIYRHQDFYRMKNNLTPPVTRTIFHNITRQHLDHGILNCAKYFINYFFYKFGLETCFLLVVNVIGQRMDFYAMLHAFGLIAVMYQRRRKAIAHVWPKYCCFLACMLAFQYLMCIGIPPAACTDYPWRHPSSRMDSNVIKWLYFPDFHTKPNPLFPLYDFMLLLCASLQRRVFEEENVTAVQLLAGDNTEICRDLDAATFSQHNPVPDFIHCRSYLDMLKVIMFSYLFWFVLTIIFITGTTRISIFCMGYLVACFYFLLFGGELLLKPIKSIMHYWDFLIAYNVFVITMKNILSIAACGYIKALVVKHCWLIQLFSLACTIKGYSKPEQQEKKECELPSDEAGIIWDSICFASLLLQRRVFMSYYFLHVVADIRASQILASRGAELFQATIVKAVKARIEEEKKSMDLLKRQMDRIKSRQQKFKRGKERILSLAQESGESHSVVIEEDEDDDDEGETSKEKRKGGRKEWWKPWVDHASMVRSGNYYLFETDSEEEEEEEDKNHEEPPKKSAFQFVYHAWITDSKTAMKERSKERRRFWQRYTEDRFTRKEPKEVHMSIEEGDQDDGVMEDEMSDGPDNILKRVFNIVKFSWVLFLALMDSFTAWLNSICQEHIDISTVLRIERCMLTQEVKKGNIPSRESIHVYYQRQMCRPASAESSLDRTEEVYTDFSPEQSHLPQQDNTMEGLESDLSTDNLSCAYTESTLLYESTLDHTTGPVDCVPKTSQRTRPKLSRVPSVDLQSSSRDSAASAGSECTQGSELYSRQGTDDTIEDTVNEQAMRERPDKLWTPISDLPPPSPQHHCASEGQTPQGATASEEWDSIIAAERSAWCRGGADIPPSYSKATGLDSTGEVAGHSEVRQLRIAPPDEKSGYQSCETLLSMSHQLTASELLRSRMFYDEKLEESESFYRSQPQFLQLCYALYNMLVAHSEMVCYLVIILNHMISASVATLVLPILIFLWAMLSVPRPSKRFWMTAIVYTEVTIVIKYFFQFGFFPFNKNVEVDKVKPFHPPNIIGVEKKEGYVHYDLVQLLALFFHRSILKCHGLWDEDEPSSGGRTATSHHSDSDSEEKTHPWSEKRPVSHDASPVSTHVRLPRKHHHTKSVLRRYSASAESNISQRSAHSRAGSTGSRASVRRGGSAQSAQQKSRKELLLEKLREQLIKAKRFTVKMILEIYIPIRQFFYNLIHPEYSAVTDVYVVMFLADTVDFIIIVFGFWAFGKHSAAADITSSLSEDQVPEAFLVMVLIQFGTMVVDRALYLRKTVMGKVIFQVILVFGIHFWMFFILPGVTERRFSQNTVAQLWYFVKCIYFGLSAYQIRCGYPTRVLGNFLTKSYNYVNLFLFQGFRLVPFLTELRAVMDWVWTDTTLSLSSWICVEDIYAHIFVLKCWRESEKRYPQPRGQKKKKVVKYGMGGMIVMLLICIVWFPLLFMSLVKSVAGVVNKPLDVSVTITLGGFQPIFTMSAQQNQLKDITESDFLAFMNSYNYEPSALQFLEAYTAEDLTVAELEGSSNSLWTISPPSRKNLMDVLSKEDQFPVTMSWSIQRNLSLGAKAEFAMDKHVTYLDMNTRQELIALLNGTSKKAVIIEKVFPCFIRAPSDSNAKPIDHLYRADGYKSILLDLERSHNGSEEIQEWWIVDQPSAGKIQIRSQAKSEKKRNAGLHLYVFSDKVSPPSLGFLAGYGIMGLYASVVLVIGKFVREFFSGISHSIMFEELPCVDRILKLCTDIFLVRETGELELEEDLYAKLIFLYRSPETMIKWTREKTK